MGNLILRGASHLDAFSVYPFPSFDMSENSDGKPSALKIAPKVCGSWAKVSPMEMELAMVVYG